MDFILSEHGMQNSKKLDLSIFDQKYCTTAVHFRFQCESFKVNLTECCIFFLQIPEEHSKVW